jgi:hypothetical protein
LIVGKKGHVPFYRSHGSRRSPPTNDRRAAPISSGESSWTK